MVMVSSGQGAGAFKSNRSNVAQASLLTLSSLVLVVACSTPTRDFSNGASGSAGRGGDNGAGESNGGHAGKSTAGSDNGSMAGDEAGGNGVGTGGESGNAGASGHDGDGDGDDCPALSAPDNGELDGSDTTPGSVATFSCAAGYELSGKAKLTCRGDGTWSSDEPSCEPKDCGALSPPQNGAVSAPDTTFGASATYSCRAGYQVSGAKKRTCDETGNWSGGEPGCLRNSCAGGLAGADLSCGGVGGDCCERLAVPGGKFNRGNDDGNPATVSAFSLDKFEVTVGRFRAFVNAGFGTQAKPPTGAVGWSSTYNQGLEADTAALVSALTDATESTWNASNDILPMNDVTWYEALAFCIWDGGALPTALQWDYAATGGDEQRKYPWGGANPGANTALAVYGCFYGSGDNCYEVGHIAWVGWSDGDKARWGQRDMGGSLNELVRDWTGAYPTTPAVCDDCANLTTTQAPQMVVMGGDFDSDATSMVSPALGSTVAVFRTYDTGFRCASSTP